jgi:hypothetical protein
MPKFIVEVKETTGQTVTVKDAVDKEDAEKKAYEATFQSGFGWDGSMSTSVEDIHEVPDDHPDEGYVYDPEEKI